MLRGFSIAIAATLFSSTLFSSVAGVQLGFPYGSQKVRGVNLGGWLLLYTDEHVLRLTSIYTEPWITPSLFDNTGDPNIIDEWTFCEHQVRTVAKSMLEYHWNSFITETDFADIASAGLNHVRIPIGYWAWDVSNGEPYVQGQLPYLDKAISWAGKYGLKVIIDLHGAPGSQNGFDNSGRKVDHPGWHTEKNAVARTSAIVKTIAAKYADNTNVVPAIAPLNEPAGFYDEMMPTIKQFWLDSYKNIRNPSPDQKGNAVVMIHDAFKGLDYWRGFMTEGEPTWSGVAMDVHSYQVFADNEINRTETEHIAAACAQGKTLSSFHLWTIVGEWSAAATDCARDLNGRGKGARYDGSLDGRKALGTCKFKTGPGSKFSDEYKTFLRQYWEAQAISFEKGAGWISWTWKTAETDDWSYKAGLQYGWIPKNPAERKYPNICDSPSSAVRQRDEEML